MDFTIVTDYIKELNPNTLLGIAALSGVAFMFINLFKGLTGMITGGIKKISTYNIEIFYANTDYNRFTKWIREHQDDFYFVREYKVSSVSGVVPSYPDRYAPIVGYDDDDNTNTNSIVPGYGSSILKVKGFPLMVFNRSVEKDKKNISEQADILKFKMYTTDKSNLYKFYNSVIKEYGEKKYPELKHSNGDWWSDLGKITKSSFPVSKHGLKLIEDIAEFRASEDWYNDRSLTFKRGYILHGCPGSGKSQLVKYLAVHFGMDLYMLNLRDDIKHIDELLSQVTRNSIILVEDIDLTGIGQRDELSDSNKGDGKSLDASFIEDIGKGVLHIMLNAIDGINSYDGSIFICTTNDISALDPALLRKGRIDVKLEIDVLPAEEQLVYFNKFYGVEYNICDSVSRTIADLQGTCINYKYDPLTAGAELGFSPGIIKTETCLEDDNDTL